MVWKIFTDILVETAAFISCIEGLDVYRKIVGIQRKWRISTVPMSEQIRNKCISTGLPMECFPKVWSMEEIMIPSKMTGHREGSGETPVKKQQPFI